MKRYEVTKTFGPQEGLSCTFRQYRSDSHCNLLHGYALGVMITFSALSLDDRKWVIDFGNLKEIKDWLHEMFDHTVLVAADDPELPLFREMQVARLCRLKTVSHVGCEAFAELIQAFVFTWLGRKALYPRVKCTRVTVFEHGANQASYYHGE